MDDAAVSDTDTLLAQIEAACRQFGMAQTTFGRLAVNDGKLVTRLQQGARVTLQTVERVHRFIAAQGGPDAPELRSEIRVLNAARPAGEFRFWGNRQKYLMFVNSTTEQQVVADRALAEIEQTQPQSPAIRLMDAGAGEGAALARTLRGLHRRHPAAPFYVVAKELGMENVRLTLDKMPDRLAEHPATVLVLTNLKHAEALRLKPQGPAAASRMIWNEVALDGDSAADFEEQIAGLDPWLGEHWQARVSADGGSVVYDTPVVLVLYRRDQRFALEPVLPKRGLARADFDFILLSQAWRSRASLAFKSERVVMPLIRGLRANGRLMTVQGMGDGPASDLVREVWPHEAPFTTGRHAILARVADDLGAGARDYQFHDRPDADAMFRFDLRTNPGELDSDPAVLTAWTAATYHAQIEDDRLAEAMAGSRYRQATRNTLLRHGGLWFNDESFVISRRPTLG